jgi:hypothetical protein
MLKSSLAVRIWIFALIAFSTSRVHAQTQEQVLVPGRTPLTAEIAEKTASFFEWALDLRFTPQQRNEYQQMLIHDWATPQKRKSIVEFQSVIDKLWASPPETRERFKGQFSQALLESLRKERSDEQARWLLAIYEAAHRGATGAQIPTSFSGMAAKELTGKWRATSVAATQYQNTYTGAPAPTSGHSFSYEFLSDGTYKSNNLMQITTYGCTSSVYSEGSGHFRVDGDHLYVEPANGKTRSQVCGGQASEKADNLAVREYVFHIEASNGQEVLVINGVDGKNRPDYYRREAR